MTRQETHEVDSRHDSPARQLAGPAASSTIAAVWVLLTFWRPTATFHFAPLLVTVAWPYASRSQLGRATTRAEATGAVAGGAAVSLLATLALALAGHLDGPTFWESPDAPFEAVLMTGIGVLWGLRVTTRRREGAMLANEGVSDQQR